MEEGDMFSFFYAPKAKALGHNEIELALRLLVCWFVCSLVRPFEPCLQHTSYITF